MFSLLAGFIKWLFSKTELQILILGLDHAGKTTMLEQMKKFFQHLEGIPLNRIPPTVGLNIGKMDISHCRVIFWDLGGQARLRSIWANYYSEAHGVLFVIDSADLSRFEEVRKTLKEILIHKDLQSLPICIALNKADLWKSNSLDQKLIEQKLGLEDLLKEAASLRLKFEKAHSISTSKTHLYDKISTGSDCDRIIDNHQDTNNGNAIVLDELALKDNTLNSPRKRNGSAINGHKESFDLVNTSSLKNEVEEELRRLREKVKVQKVSALTMVGVDESVRWLVNQGIIVKNSRTIAQPPSIPS